MNKITLYILLMLTFLGLSKSFSVTEKGTIYIKNKEVLGHHFEGTPVTIVLIDAFQTGFLIKTYYHKYKIIYSFKQPRIIISRVSYKFFHENLTNIGLSIFSRSERHNKESTLPMPPGNIFIGDLAYGSWNIDNSGDKIWIFHRAYRHFYQVLGWGSFRPNFEFYKKMLIHQEQETPFYGVNEEFGATGFVTKQAFPDYFQKKQIKTVEFNKFFKRFIDLKPSRAQS